MNVCDQAIFKKVYYEWNAPLQRFMQSKGLDIGKSADMVQDAFMRMWNNCSKVTVEKSKSFLFTVANNLFIDEYRKVKTRLKLKEVHQNVESKEDGQFHLESKEFKSYLEEAIDGMTDASKEVFIMHRFNDMSYQEIADSLQLSKKSIEKRMSKALKHLSTKIEEWKIMD